MENIIETKNVTFCYKANIKIVDSLNLSVPAESVYGFLGPNGAGKTTTIRLLLGLFPDYTENILLFGKHYKRHRLEIYSKIGSLIEQPSLYEHLTAFDNLRIAQIARNVNAKRIDEVLEIVKLLPNKKQRVKEFSLGMKQRLGLAITMLAEPELLLLDEPTNGLDPKGIIEVREIIKSLVKDHKKTVFVSSHLLSEVEKMCTHVGIINKGKLLFDGKIEDLSSLKNNSTELIISTDNPEKAVNLLKDEFQTAKTENGNLVLPTISNELIASTIKKLVQNEISIYEVKNKQANLEEVFIHLTENSN